MDVPQCSTQWPSGSGGCLTLFAGSSTLRRLQWVVRFARKCNTATGTLCTLVFLAIFMICSAAIYSLSLGWILKFFWCLFCAPLYSHSWNLLSLSEWDGTARQHKHFADTEVAHSSVQRSGRFSDGLSESRRTARADGAGASSSPLC